MRKPIFFIAAILFAVACQQPRVIEYVKYVNDAGVPRISAEEAKKDLDAGNAVFVDSRGQAAFDVEHLPGAIVIPYQPGVEQSYDTLPKGKKIIVYCS
ncbi:MAG: rhodanese-like domain-containing protein [Pyrinomonadaceae bacterium]